MVNLTDDMSDKNGQNPSKLVATELKAQTTMGSNIKKIENRCKKATNGCNMMVNI